MVLSTLDFSATPQYQLLNPLGVSPVRGGPGSTDATVGPFASSVTPAEMQSFYGTNQIFFGNVQGNGAGQTIAIVDAYDNPSLIDSFNGAVTSGDLYAFDHQFGLNNNINFTKYSETGSTTTLPAADPNWAVEEALDVEWAHVMAPDANIDLVEATTQNFQFDMTAAIKEAASLPGVSVVSMSFGYPELPNEVANFNSVFTTPAGHQGVSFISATSDTGSMGAGNVVNPYSGRPAFLPNVISVGGTSLNMASGSPTLETAWNQGGGGFSKYVPEPTYQEAVQQTGFRSAPDVSADANLYAGGVALYDTYAFGFASPWNQVGGTSLATPLWAGLITDANQGRVLAGGTTLDGPSQTLPALYSLPHYDFNDILAGDNEGEGASVGYDEVTGLGTPRANVLVPDLAAYGLGVQQAPGSGVGVMVQPPSTVNPGASFGLSIAVRDSFGNTDSAFTGTATLTSSLTNTVVATATVTNGVAVFDGLTLAAGQSATYTVAVAGTTFTTPTALVTAASTSEPPGSLKLYPAPSDASLATALQAAASSTATDITIVLQSGIYALNAATASPLVIDNTSGVAKTITIQGAGINSTIIDPSRIAGWGNSIFQVLGATGAPLQVKIEGLTIKDGVATAGLSGSQTAVGGGLLVERGHRVALAGGAGARLRGRRRGAGRFHREAEAAGRSRRRRASGRGRRPLSRGRYAQPGRRLVPG